MTPEQSLKFLKEHQDDLKNYVDEGRLTLEQTITVKELIEPSPMTMLTSVFYVTSDNKYLHDVFNVLSTRPSATIFFKGMSVDEMKQILEKYKDVIGPKTRLTFDNCRFKERKYQYLTQQQFIDMIDRVKAIADYVSHFNLSNYEKTIFLFDLIKQKEYRVNNQASINTREAKNNSLYEVLFDDYITCLGYSNIFQAVLQELGFDIKEHDISKRNEAISHSITSVVINDPKYGIDGAYIYDITKDNFDKMLFDYSLNINSYEGLSQTTDYVEDIINSVPQRIQERVSTQPIPEEIRKQALYNVRRIAHSIDPYLYDEEISMEDDKYAMLSEKDTSETEMIYSLRQLLREKMKNENASNENEISRELQYILEEHPELQDKLEELIEKSKAKESSEEEVIDYTENPVMKR